MSMSLSKAEMCVQLPKHLQARSSCRAQAASLLRGYMDVPRYVHARYMDSVRFCEPCPCTERQQTKVAFVAASNKSLAAVPVPNVSDLERRSCFGFRKAPSIRYRSSPDKVPFA
ncbi:uncharacterized protein TrAtP1_004254 [Trichoderma atroviride]|uniref:uncharacterized protein n=1 Tax=Hypocrea atroviridis TaxID=63577 RepID=UPI00331C696B|nr:hypothetical protein TrAtP1_004254 [Trichoderma atroviride]